MNSDPESGKVYTRKRERKKADVCLPAESHTEVTAFQSGPVWNQSGPGSCSVFVSGLCRFVFFLMDFGSWRFQVAVTVSAVCDDSVV